MTTEFSAAPQQEQVDQLRAAGLPDALIQQILGLDAGDQLGLARQYDQSAYLRKGALSASAKGPLGVLAQGIMGLAAKKADTTYSDALRNYRNKQVEGRRRWFGARYGTGQITPDARDGDAEYENPR